MSNNEGRLPVVVIVTIVPVDIVDPERREATRQPVRGHRPAESTQGQYSRSILTVSSQGQYSLSVLWVSSRSVVRVNVQGQYSGSVVRISTHAFSNQGQWSLNSRVSTQGQFSRCTGGQHSKYSKVTQGKHFGSNRKNLMGFCFRKPCTTHNTEYAQSDHTRARTCTATQAVRLGSIGEVLTQQMRPNQREHAGFGLGFSGHAGLFSGWTQNEWAGVGMGCHGDRLVVWNTKHRAKEQLQLLHFVSQCFLDFVTR